MSPIILAATGSEGQAVSRDLSLTISSGDSQKLVFVIFHLVRPNANYGHAPNSDPGHVESSVTREGAPPWLCCSPPVRAVGGELERSGVQADCTLLNPQACLRISLLQSCYSFLCKSEPPGASFPSSLLPQFSLPQLKPGWSAFTGWPQLLYPCPKGGASATAPPEIWRAGPPPFPYLTSSSHPSPGVAAAAGSWREGMGLATLPGLAAPNRQGAESFSLLGENRGTLPSRVQMREEGAVDFDPNVLVLRPGRQSPARCLNRP